MTVEEQKPDDVRACPIGGSEDSDIRRLALRLAVAAGPACDVEDIIARAGAYAAFLARSSPA